MDDLTIATGGAPAALAVIPGSASAAAADAAGVLQIATGVSVANRQQLQDAAELLRRVKTLWVKLEGHRVSVTGPLNQALKGVNDWFRDPLAKLRQAETHLKDEMGRFEQRERARIAEEERQAAERARAEQAELERRAALAAEKGKEEKAAELRTRAAAVVPAPSATAPVRARGVSFGEHWTYTVVDEAAIPREYLVVDHAKIRGVVTAMKAGTRIPGITVQMKPQVGARGER